MAIYECRILFKFTSPTPHRSTKRNPAGTNLCAGYSFWTPSAPGGGTSFNNGNVADHRHMASGVDTFTVVLYDLSNTVPVNTTVSATLTFRAKYIGSAQQSPFVNPETTVTGHFLAGTGASAFPYAYLLAQSGSVVSNSGSYDFSVQFTVQSGSNPTFFIDPEMDVNPGAGST